MEETKNTVTTPESAIPVIDEEVLEEAVVETETTEEAAEETKTEVSIPSAPIDTTAATVASQDEFDFDDSELGLDDEDESEATTEEATDDDAKLEEITEKFRKQIKEKLNPVSEVAKKQGSNIVVKGTVSWKSAMEKLSTTAKTVDWPLLSAGKKITMKSWSGKELESLNRGTSGRNAFNTLKEIYHAIYDHIASEKPDFENWLKTTSFFDLDNIYMAIYKASFADANYLPYQCGNKKCHNTFLSDNIDIMDMVKFNDDKTKERFMSIYNDTDEEIAAGLYPTTIIPVTDDIAIGFREPSIWNTIFENSTLDREFIDKHNNMLARLIYIDAIYQRNDDGTYSEISYGEDPSSVAKTTKRRIAVYSKIISQLPSDAYNKITEVLAEFANLSNSMEYVMPEIKCPECGEVIQEEVKEATTLLFSRHQLSLLSLQ